MVKAYSYVRWSSDRQTSGDSLRRQRELSAKYAADHGLELDQSLKDEGISAFHGVNRRRGDLATFLDQIEGGLIEPGSFLLLESLDRISREQIVEAQTLFLRIINAGITIVTVLPHRQTVYSREIINENPHIIIMAVLEMIRANEESAHKSERVAKAHAKNRQLARETGRNFSKNLPAWVSLVDGQRVLNNRASVIEEIFTWLAQGIGRHKIVSMLNGRVEPVLGNYGQHGWHPSHIHHLLHQKTVIGFYHPHTVTMVDGRRVRTPEEPIPGYYPPAIEEDLYYLAHAAVAKNRMSVGRKGKRFNNLLTAGLARCDVCGGHVAYQNKGKNTYPQYICSRGARNACSNKTKYRHADIEAAILNHVAEIEVEDIKPPQDRSLEVTLAARTTRREMLQAEIANLYGELASGLKGIAGQIKSREAEVENLEQEIESLRRDIADRASAPTVNDTISFVAEVRKTMGEGTDEEIYLKRAQLAVALRGVVTDVVFFAEGHVYLILLNGLIAYEINGARVRKAKVIAPVLEAFVPHTVNATGEIVPADPNANDLMAKLTRFA
jgi:DNA invertase Pin-like site-specific DNA recombinase